MKHGVYGGGGGDGDGGNGRWKRGLGNMERNESGMLSLDCGR